MQGELKDKHGIWLRPAWLNENALGQILKNGVPSGREMMRERSGSSFARDRISLKNISAGMIGITQKK
jgi:hypothetical protein